MEGPDFYQPQVATISTFVSFIYQLLMLDAAQRSIQLALPYMYAGCALCASLARPPTSRHRSMRLQERWLNYIINIINIHLPGLVGLLRGANKNQELNISWVGWYAAASSLAMPRLQHSWQWWLILRCSCYPETQTTCLAVASQRSASATIVGPMSFLVN